MSTELLTNGFTKAEEVEGYYLFFNLDTLAFTYGADGELEIFALDDDGALNHICDKSTDGTWDYWTPLGGSLQGHVSAVTGNDGKLAVFGLGRDKNIYGFFQKDSHREWHPCRKLAPAASQAPVCAKNADGRLEVFWLLENGEVGHIWQKKAGSDEWSAWEKMGGKIAKSLRVKANADGRLEVFGLAADGSVWHNYQTAPNSGWKGWTTLGQTFSGDIFVELGKSGQLALFGCHADGSVYYSYQNSDSRPSGWHEWIKIGGGIRPETLYAVSNPDGRFEVFGLNQEKAVQHAWQAKAASDSGWSAWESLGGSLLRLLAVVRPDAKGLLLFGLKDDHGIYIRRRPDLTGAWKEWQVLQNEPTLGEWYYSVVKGSENGKLKTETCLVEMLGGVREVTFTDVQGEARMEGDIILGRTAQLLEKAKTLSPTEDLTGIYTNDEGKHWPAGILPVQNNKSFALSLKVLTAWEKDTPVRYVDYDKECNPIFFPDFIQVWRTMGDSSSWVGRKGGAQGLNVAIFSANTSGPHELGHALGLEHEQSRWDRDTYITVNWDNIKDRKNHEHNFYNNIWGTKDHGPYDYGSLMHYSRGAFAKCNKDTIETKDRSKQKVIGQRKGPSTGDLAAISAMYAKQASPEKGLTRLFRFYFTSNHKHLFTPDWQFSSNSKERKKQNELGCQSEGILGYIFETKAEGTTPLFQLYNPKSKDCVCTVLQSEVKSAEKLGYSSKTIGYVHTEPKNNRYRLVHRFYNHALCDHLFTVRQDEIEWVRKMQGWVEETGQYGDFYVYCL